MTRIIAGRLRSLAVPVPESGTRPTTDRVREALFSAVEARLDLADIAVLDLFAGSGALGLEAISRGAGSCDFVESAPPAARLLERTCREAATRLDLPASALQVHRSALPGFVSGTCPRTGGYDLVLIDPPYADASVFPELLERLAAGGWLSEIAYVVVETSARTPATPLPPGLRLELTRNYGETRIELAEWLPERAGDPVAAD